MKKWISLLLALALFLTSLTAGPAAAAAQNETNAAFGLDADAYPTADGGDLWMSLYNPPPDMLETVRQLALSEGLFVRRAAE